MSNRGNDLLLRLLQFRFDLKTLLNSVNVCLRNVTDGAPFLSRYPKIMTDEGVAVVRQWLGSTNTLEEGQ